jgi:L-arabinokinase
VPRFEPSYAPAEGLGSLVLFRLIEEAADFFAPDREILVTRAPGRLDVLGGFAAEFGGPGLQCTTGEAAGCAIQRRADQQIRLWSPGGEGLRTQRLSTGLADLGLPDRPIDLQEARAFLCADPRDRWSGYLLGALLVLVWQRGLRVEQGLDLLVHSDVPEGRGLGASTAVVVAVLQALAAAYELPLSARDLQALAPQVEALVQGAAGRPTDAAAAVFGRADHLLVCRPGDREPVALPMPAELEFVALECGPRSASAALDAAGLRCGIAHGLSLLRQPNGHATAAPIAEFSPALIDSLPMTVTGQQLQQPGLDALLAEQRLAADRHYAVREPTRSVLASVARAERFASLWQQGPAAGALPELGELLFAEHAAQAACGLGHPHTDVVIAAARARQAAGAALYGARAMAAGSGSAVLLFGQRGQVWYEALRLKKVLLQQTGHSGQVCRWSSPGAASFPTVVLRPAHD